jgi:hypothetical protein
MSFIFFCFNLRLDDTLSANADILGDTPNYTEKFRGIYTVGWNYRRKRPNTVGKRPTVGIIFRPSPQFFHNFVSFHPILMFLTILESGDKTNSLISALSIFFQYCIFLS